MKKCKNCEIPCNGILIDMDTVTPAHKYTPQDRKEIARQKKELTNALIKALLEGGVQENLAEKRGNVKISLDKLGK